MTMTNEVTFFEPENPSPQVHSVSAFVGVHAEDPAGYISQPALTDAINASILLGQPLLLTGEPGVGKTTVGRAVAHNLGLPLLEFTVKSTSRAVDLFYEYDAVGRFQAAEADRADAARLMALAGIDTSSVPGALQEQLRRQAETEPSMLISKYIKVRALGRAILNASEPTRESKLLDPSASIGAQGRKYHSGDSDQSGRWEEITWPPGVRQSVVIIDEIDKAPSDFCNDLLDELEQMRFQVPELATYTESSDAPRFGGDLGPGARPIVFITSNQERPLPDAFLRRCCFHHIEMPEGDDLERIIESRLRDAARLPEQDMTQALLVFKTISGLPLGRKPGLAELLNWLRYLAFEMSTAGLRLPDKDLLSRSLTALVKDPLDREKAMAWVKQAAIKS